MTMIERIEKIIEEIEKFNETYDQFRIGTNPNEPYAIFFGKVVGYDGDGYPNDTPEEDRIEINF